MRNTDPATTPPANPPEKQSRQKWLCVAAMFLMIFVCLGFCSSNKSIYLAAITEALGIKRSLFSINDSCRFVATAVGNLFFGVLIRRFGARRMISAGFVALILATAVYATAETVYLFYLGGFLLGLGFCWTTTTMVGSVVHRLFPDKAGKIMGAILAANGVGAALSTQILSPIIYAQGNPFGYRDAYWLVVAILAATGAVVLLIFRDAGASAARDRRAHVAAGAAMGEPLPRRYFLAAAACVFFTGMVLQGVSGIAAAHMRDVGLNAAFVATVLSVHSLALTVAKFLVGVWYDRFGLRVTMILCNLAALAALLLLALLTDSAAGRAMAMGYGVFSALALPLETIMLPLIAGDLFDNRSFDRMLGILVSVNTAGYAVGAPLSNWSYDALGRYDAVLFAYLGVTAAACVVFQRVLRAARRSRARVRTQA